MFPGEAQAQDFKSVLSTRKSGFLRIEGPKTESIISTGEVFLLEDEGQFCLAVKNPFYLPLRNPLYDLEIQDFRSPKYYRNTQLETELSVQNSNRFGFELRESAFFNPDQSEAFMKSIEKDIMIHEVEVGLTPLPHGKAAFSLSPELLLSQVQKACQDTLKRSSIDPNQPINMDYLVKLHQNATQYLRDRGVSLGSKKQPARSDEFLALAAQSRESAPANPMIFYQAVTRESGVRVLKPILILPVKLQEKIRSEREGNVFAKVLGRFEAGITTEQMLEKLHEGTELGDALRKTLFGKGNIAKDIDDAATRYREELAKKPADQRLKDDIHIEHTFQSENIAIVARDDLMVDANQKGKSAAFASLNGDVKLGSKKKRTQTGSSTFIEEIDDQREFDYEGNLTIKAGGNIETQAVKLKAGSGNLEAGGSIVDQTIALESKTESHSEGRSETRKTTKHQASSFQFDKNLKIKGNQVFLVGTEAQADQISLEAKEQVQVLGVVDEEHISETKEEETGAWFWKGKKTETTHTSTGTFKGAHLKSAQPIEMKAKEVTLQAPKLDSTETRIEAETVKFKLGKNVKHSSSVKSSENAFWISQDVGKRTDESYNQLQALGPLKIKASKIELEEAQGHALEYIDHLEFDRNQVAQIQTILDEIHTHEHDSISAPGPALIAAVAILSSVATGGVGGAAVAGLGLQAAGGVVASATAAAISSLSAQIATQLTLGILAQQSSGDILGKIFQTDTLKNMVTASVSAGALYELNGAQQAASTSAFVRKIEGAGTQAGIGMGVNLAFGEQNLEDALKNAGVQFVGQASGQIIAGEIGEQFRDKNDAWARGLHKLAHGAAAGGIAAGGAALTGQDVGSAAAGAAAGAMTAEIVADILSQPLNEEVYKDVQEKQAELGRELTQGEKQAIFSSKVGNIALISKLSGAVSGLLASGEQGLNAGRMSAGNAIDNNFWATAVPVLLTGYMFYEWEKSNVQTEDAIVSDPLGETVFLGSAAAGTKAIAKGAQKLAPVVSQTVKGLVQAAQESEIIGNEIGAVGDGVGELVTQRGGRVAGAEGKVIPSQSSNPVFRTDGEAAKVAKDLGFRKVNERVKGQAIFTDGKRYITRDVDGHNGGAWKVADSVKNLGSKKTRQGTFDANLGRIGD